MSRGAERIILPLDVEKAAVHELARKLAPHVGVFKIGPGLFLEGGPDLLNEIKALGRKIFLDVKLYDIPETVARACRQAVRLGVDYMTVHASGGSRMLSAARDAGAGVRLLGVTVLTSFDSAQLAAEWNLTEGIPELVSRWARLSADAGLAGIVCSPHELASVKQALKPGMIAVVPGIRSAKDAPGDQRRTMPAGEAIKAGADLLVVGRPIIASPDPVAAAVRIGEEIEKALG